MDVNKRLKLLCLLVCITAAGKCYAQQSDDLFSKFPSEAVFSLTESIGAYTRIVCEVPGMSNDTVWVESHVQPLCGRCRPIWRMKMYLSYLKIKMGKKLY